MIPKKSRNNNVASEARAAFSFITPRDNIINTREFSRRPIPPIEIGIIAITVIIGTIKKNAVRSRFIPKALAAK